MIWLTVSQITSRLIRGVIIIYAARVLGAAEYGAFSYALGLAAFFTIFADIGIVQILTREVAKKPERRSHYFVTSLWIKSALLLGTAFVVIFIAPHFSKIEAAKALIPFVALITIFDGIRELSLAFLRAREKMEMEAFVTILTNLAITAAGFIILMYSHSAKALAFSYATSAGIGALIAIALLREEFKKIFTHLDRSLIRPIIISSIPFVFISGLGAFALNTDMVMLGWWRSAEEIGFYAAAQKIIQILYTLPSILASATFPTLSRFIGQEKTAEARVLMEKIISLAFMIATPIAIGGVILSKPIILLIYGAEYAPAIIVFRILITTTVMVFPAALSYNLILAHDKQTKALWFVALGSMGNIVFNTLLIPTYGIVGSAVSTIVAQLLNNIFLWQTVKRISPFETIKYLKKIIFASLIMGAFSLFLNGLHMHVIANVIVSALLYFGVLYALKEELLEEAMSMFSKARVTSSSSV